MDFSVYRHERTQRVEQFLTKLFADQPQEEYQPSHLLKAMEYSVLNGGKRLRPLLVYATGEAFGCSVEQLDAAAAAVELIHCYSLIHDDLPAMDDDDLRRGKPTCHKAFNEATAILAGDALQSMAFQILTNPTHNPVTPLKMVQMIQILAQKSGVEGMVGGQALDIHFEGNANVSIGQLKMIHQKKTGALIEAAVLLGGIIGCNENEPERLSNLEEYAKCIGLAFQIQDDILDLVSNTTTLGKTARKDIAQLKATFPSRLGLETAKQYAKALHQQALEAIDFLNGANERLIEISNLFINRAF